MSKIYTLIFPQKTRSRKSTALEPKNQTNIISSSVKSTYEQMVASLSNQIESLKGNISKIKFLFQNESAFNTIIYIISKHQKLQSELFLLENYLSTLDRLIFLLSSNTSNLNEILFNISFNLQTEKVLNGNIVYKYGDKGNKYYIILKGNVSILMPKEYHMRMNVIDYIKLLIRLYIVKENEMLIQTISFNKKTYDINLIDVISYTLPYLDKNEYNEGYKINPLRNNNILKIITKEEHNLLRTYITIVQRDYKLFKLHLSKVNKEKIPTINDYINLSSHIPTLSKQGEPIIKLLKYNEVNKLNQSDIFGEIGLQYTNAKRNATVMACDDTVLGTLTRDIYNLNIRDILTKVKRNNIKFLLTFKLFSGLNWNFLDKKLYNYFTIKKLHRNDILIYQHQYLFDLCFIKSGEFEVQTKMSVDDIKQFSKKLNPHLHFPPTQLDDTSTKENRKISIIKDNDVIGFADMVGCDGNSAFTITCISKEGCLLCIEKKLIEDLALKFPEIKKQYIHLTKLKCQMMINRLSSVSLINFKEDLTKRESKHIVLKKENIFKRNEIKNNNLAMYKLSIPKFHSENIFPSTKLKLQTRSESNSCTKRKIFKLKTKVISSCQLNDDSNVSLNYTDHYKNQQNKTPKKIMENYSSKERKIKSSILKKRNVLDKINKDNKENDLFLNKILSYGYNHQKTHKLNLLTESFQTFYSGTSFEKYILNYNENTKNKHNYSHNHTDGNYYYGFNKHLPITGKSSFILKPSYVCNNVYIQ